MLLSRVADALYWLSRYLERAEHTARVLEVRFDLALDRSRDSDGWDFERLFKTVRVDRAAGAPSSPAKLIDALVFDLSTSNSVAACLTAARDNARQVREEISSDMWEQINALFLRLNQARAAGSSSGPARRRRLSICIAGKGRCGRPITSNGWDCCDRVLPSRRTAAATPRTCARSVSPSFSC
jgi:uncharacterized alpha-E superfamily protein